MKRAIKFRGRCNDTYWVYGDLEYSKGNNNARIHTYDEDGYYKRQFEVNPDTIGQFTGLTDCNGKEIYEGDIVTFDDTPYNVYSSPYTGKVVMYKGAWSVEYWSVLGHYTYAPLFRDDFAGRKTKIEGNVFDNPDLLTDKLNKQ